MGYFPFFVDIEGKTGLIVGGGRVAAHKLHKLVSFRPALKVVAPEILPEILEVERQNSLVKCFSREFEESDLDKVFFVIAASDDERLNERISLLCRGKNILVNVVDDKEKCSFIFPALINEGALTVGVSTAGASPEVAAGIKNEVAAAIPANIDEILDYLADLRLVARESISDGKLRAGFLKETARLCMEKGGIFTGEETMRRLETYTGKENNGTVQGKAVLVGAGCGGYDLISLKGIRAVRQAEVLVYDDLLDSRLLEYIAESCERIYVGKRSGRHSVRQEEINTLLIQKVQEGRNVVRLKGGDPFVFGRGGEELMALREAGIPAEYIPGITSSIAVPAFAGIPVTHRGAARSFHVITGHAAASQNQLPEDIEVLAKLNGTLVFLMGFAHLEEIAGKLMENGKNPETPAAVIHGKTDNTADAVRGTLENIVQKVRNSRIEMPAVIVIGNTAGLEL